MNKETFIRYLNKPDLLDQDSIPELDSVIDEVPYFQTARILLALNLSKENHPRFDKELSSTAIHVADRRLLRDHIENLISAEPPTIESPQPMEPDPEIVEEEEQPAIAIEEAEREKAVETVAAEKPQPAIEEEPIDDEEDRIAKLKSIVEARLKSIEEERRQSAKVEEEVVEASLMEENLPQETAIAAGQLIDEFIKNEPSISRAQATFFNPVDAAKESVVDEEDIVSETLARIYFDQRKYEKAINIYQKLSLNNPEKSSYFARLIENALEELKR